MRFGFKLVDTSKKLPISLILSKTKNWFFVNLGGKNNAYLWLKYLIISTLISIIKVADVRIF